MFDMLIQTPASSRSENEGSISKLWVSLLFFMKFYDWKISQLKQPLKRFPKTSTAVCGLAPR